MAKNYLRAPKNEAVDDRQAKALKLWEHGLSTQSIAERFGVRAPLVARWLRKANVKLTGNRRDIACCGGGGSGGRASKTMGIRDA